MLGLPMPKKSLAVVRILALSNILPASLLDHQDHHQAGRCAILFFFNIFFLPQPFESLEADQRDHGIVRVRSRSLFAMFLDLIFL